MAEKAAHFTTISDEQPSIFDVVAQKSLDVTIQPALQKIAQLLNNFNPKNFSWLLEYYDESFLVLNGFLQYYYLKNHEASFSEYFYGLKREHIRQNGRFSHNKKQISWIFLVILPYIKRKLEDKVMQYRLEEAEVGLWNRDFNSKMKKIFLTIHSTFEITWGSWILANYLRYMSGEANSQLPSLQLINLKLVYSMEQDNAQAFWTALFRGKLSCSQLSTGLLQNAVRSVLEISAFFVQFLQAWNTEQANYNVTALPTTPVPHVDPQSEKYKDKCPLCLQMWKIPTVLPVSGYVFCFSCIIRHLREHRKCPITNLPAQPLDIIRLYDAD